MKGIFRCALIFILCFFSVSYAETLKITSKVKFSDYLKKEILKQSSQVCTFSDCTILIPELLKSLGYEVKLENNSTYVVTKNLKIADVRIEGVPKFLKREVAVIKNFLLEQFYSRELVENARLLLLFKLRSTGFRDVKVNVESLNGYDGYNVVFNLEMGLPHVISKISVECQDDVQKKFIEKILKNEIGKRLDQENLVKLRNVVKNHFLKLGYYNIEVSYSWKVIEKTKNEKRALLLLKVNFGKRYLIEIQGNNRIKTEEIKKAITFIKDKSFDEFEIKRSKENIIEIYKTKGFPFVNVTVEIKNVNSKVVKVKFLIAEGPKIKVRKVKVVFNGEIDAEIKGDVENLCKKLRYGFYNEKKIKNIEGEIGYLLKENGYYGIGSQFYLKERGKFLLFSVNVSGRKIVRSIANLPNNIFKKLVFPVPYNENFETTLKLKVSEYYSQRGYLDAKVEIRKKERKIGSVLYFDLTVLVDKGTRYKFGFLIFDGLSRTKIESLYPIIVINPGDNYGREIVIDQYSLLSRTQLFTMIDLKEFKVSSLSVINPVYGLKESPLFRLKGFVGYSTDAGISLKASGSSSSPFGRGLYFFLSGEYRQNEGSNVLFKIGKSGVFGKRNRGYLTLTRKRELFESFDVVRYITRVEISRRQWGKITQHYGVELSREIVSSEDMPGDTFYKKTFFITSDFDWRNSFTNPTQGYRIFNKVSYTGDLLGGDANYLLFEIKGLRLKTVLKDKLIAVLRVGSGYIKSLKIDGVPIQDRFYLGGAESVRGYAYGVISPYDNEGNSVGGNFYTLAGFELRYNLFSPVQVAIFYDAGQVFPDAKDFTISGWYSSIGAGLRYLTPVGPLRIDYGYKLKKIPGQGPGRFHLSFGFPF